MPISQNIERLPLLKKTLWKLDISGIVYLIE